MKLRLRRNQKSGILGRSVTFTLDAFVDLDRTEAELVRKYGLGKETVYDSESRRKHLDTMAQTGQGRAGVLRGLTALAMATLTLRITIDSLTSGQHIETKNIDELLAAEAAIREACEKVKVYLDTAATCDGREEVVEV